MTKKEIAIFAVCVNVIFIIAFLPLLLSFSGYIAVGAQAYTVDEDDTVYLVANKQIRVITSYDTVITYKSPFFRTDSVETDGQSIRVFSGLNYAVLNGNGSVIDQGSVAEREPVSKRDPVIRGDATYRYRSVLGFYRITKETDGKTVVRYQMPVVDTVLRISIIIGVILFAVFCIGAPIWFSTQGRIAKDGTILPPKHEQYGDMVTRGRFS